MPPGASAQYIERRVQQPRFAHARSVRNAIERARLRHANRIYEAARTGSPTTLDDLVRIEPADILASRVFAAATEED